MIDYGFALFVGVGTVAASAAVGLGLKIKPRESTEVGAVPWPDCRSRRASLRGRL